MFFHALSKLSASDVHELSMRGVPPQRVSEWRAKKRLPTRAQALAFSQVTGLDFGKLEYELALIETAKDAQKNAGFAALLQSVATL